jgi:hypothetical protein
MINNFFKGIYHIHLSTGAAPYLIDDIQMKKTAEYGKKHKLIQPGLFILFQMLIA